MTGHERVEFLVEATVATTLDGGGSKELARTLAGANREELLEVLARLAELAVTQRPEQQGVFGPGQVCDYTITQAAERFGVTPEEIRGDSRLRVVSDARAVAMWAARDAGLTFGDIGNGFGKDRTGVTYAVNKAASEPRLLTAARGVAEELQGALVAEPTPRTNDSVPKVRHLQLVPSRPGSITASALPPQAPKTELPGSVFEQVLALSAATFALEPEQLLGEERTRRVSDARLVAMGALKMSGMTLTAIARPFGRHHTTVLDALRRVEATPPLNAYAEQICARVSVPAAATSSQLAELASLDEIPSIPHRPVPEPTVGRHLSVVTPVGR